MPRDVAIALRAVPVLAPQGQLFLRYSYRGVDADPTNHSTFIIPEASPLCRISISQRPRRCMSPWFRATVRYDVTPRDLLKLVSERRAVSLQSG